MFWYWPHGQNSFSGPNVIEMFGSDWKLYAADLPAVAFAFTGTFCLFPVFQESEDKSHARMEKVLGLSTIICCFGYQIVSIIGGLTFGVGIGHDPFTGGNAKSYLYDFPPNHYAMSICCVAIIVVITLLYAVLDFPMVNAAIQTIRMIPLPFAIDYRDHFFNWKYSRRALTLCGMVVIVFINLQFDSLVTLFGLCGGWGISFVVYVIPSIIGILGRKSRTRSEQVFYVISLLASLGMVAMFTLVTFG